MRRTLASTFAALILLLPAALRAQTLPAAGGPSTLDVATWNVKWFGDPNQAPSDARQFTNVLQVIQSAEIDLWALQEIADPADFERLVDSLGAPYDGELASIPSFSGAQRTGFVWNTDVVQPTLVQHILTESQDDFAGRPPLLLRARVSLPGAPASVTFVAMHMKAFGDAASYERRRNASESLKNHLDFLYPSAPFVVLGDLNDELGASTYAGEPSPYRNFLDDAEDYTFLTLPLDEANEATFCSTSTCASGSTLDHILITDELAPAYEEGSARRYTEVLEISSYRSTTSDHLPVLARFDFAKGTDAERGASGRKAELTAYPNPFGSSVTLSFEAECSGPVSLQVADAVGRLRTTLYQPFVAAGTSTMEIPVQEWPAGVYFARLTACGAVMATRMVRLP